MRTEEDIFIDLFNLCASPGYIHAIAFFCFRDNTVSVDESNNIVVKNRFEQLTRNEISTLIGLMIKTEIIYDLPTPDVFQEHLNKTENLLKEMRYVFQNPLFSSINDDAVIPHQNSLTMSNLLRDNIFYGPESAYTFQYLEMAVARYEADNQWLQQNKLFSIQDVKNVCLAIEEFQNNKLMKTQEQLKNASPENWAVLPIFTFTIEDIVNVSSISKSTIVAVLDSFTHSEGDKNDSFNSIQDFNSSNATPILKTHDGKYILFQLSSLGESIYESPFYWFIKDESYKNLAAKNRGAFAEEFCRKCLKLVFGEKNVSKNINVYNSNNEIVGEIDVLVVFGGRAIIIQAKSKQLTIKARKGQDEHIKNDFKKSIQDAYEQGLSCAKILCDSKYTKRSHNDQKINIPDQLKEIYILCVVSDHYPSLNFQGRHFLKHETTDVIQPPIVLDVFAVDIISEFLHSPLYFLSYVNKRVNYTNKIIASNELVILAHHLSYNFWGNNFDIIHLDDALLVDLDSAMFVRRLKITGNPTPDGILTRLTSTVIYKIIKCIESMNNSAAIELGFFLLSLSEQSMLGINKNMEAIAKRCKKDNKPHNFSMFFNSMGGLTVHGSSVSDDIAMKSLQIHCETKKYSLKATKWFGVCINPDDLSLRFCLVLDFKWEQQNDMDVILHNMESSNSEKTISKKKKDKIARNNRCHCGSGRKYKKCCLK